MHSLPSSLIEDKNLRLRFSDLPPAQFVVVQCVIDLTDFGDVLGIEVLDWRRQLSGGTIAEASPTNGKIRWAYDDEIDALSIHFKDGYSQLQKSATCNVGIDVHKHVVCLDLPIPEVGQRR